VSDERRIVFVLDDEVIALLRSLLGMLTHPEDKFENRLRAAEGRIGTLRRDVDAMLREDDE